MSVIAIASVKGSPGVSSLAIAIGFAWHRPILGVEADVSGGCWAVRHGLSCDPGLVSWAASRQTTTWDSVVEHATPLSESLAVVCAPMIPEQVRAAMSVLDERFATWPEEPDVIIDVGRISADRLPNSITVADTVLLVCRPAAEEAGPMQVLAERVRDRVRKVAMASIGQHPFDPGEVASVCGVPLLGVLPDDARAAQRCLGGRVPKVYRAAIANLSRQLAEMVAMPTAQSAESPDVGARR